MNITIDQLDNGLEYRQDEQFRGSNKIFWNIENKEITVYNYPNNNKDISVAIKENRYISITGAEVYGILRSHFISYVTITETLPILGSIGMWSNNVPNKFYMVYFTITLEEYNTLLEYYMKSSFCDNFSWLKEGF